MIPSASRGELVGDRQLLQRAADSYRDNLARLKTWSGEVLYTWRESRRDVDNTHTVVKCRITFATIMDRSPPLSRYVTAITSDAIDSNGRLTPRLPLQHRCGMLRDGAFYETKYRDIDVHKPRHAVLHPRRDEQPGWNYATPFDPVFFLKDEGIDPGDRWQLLVKEADLPQLSATVVERDPYLDVTISPSGEDAVGVYKYTIALNQGGVTRKSRALAH